MHVGTRGILQAGLTITAMLSPEANRASRMQWITTAILAYLLAWRADFSTRETLNEEIEKAPAST
jgi:hypothetical protein